MTEINVKIQEKSRKVIAAYGTVFGKQLLTVRQVNIDNKYFEKRNNANETGIIVPHRPIHRYKIQRIDITSLRVRKDIDGTLAIVINESLKDEKGNSIEIIRPIEMPRFNVEPTTENIQKAIEAQVNGVGEPLYFNNVDKLTEAVNRANKNEMIRAKALIDDIEGAVRCLEHTIEKDTKYAMEYKKSLGENEDVEVHVTVTEE